MLGAWLERVHLLGAGLRSPLVRNTSLECCPAAKDSGTGEESPATMLSTAEAIALEDFLFCARIWDASDRGKLYIQVDLFRCPHGSGKGFAACVMN